MIICSPTKEKGLCMYCGVVHTLTSDVCTIIIFRDVSSSENPKKVVDIRPIISKILNEIVYEEKQVSWFEW